MKHPSEAVRQESMSISPSSSEPADTYKRGNASVFLKEAAAISGESITTLS
jgi:hypothetical protein